MTSDEINQIVLRTLGSYVNVDEMIQKRSYGKYYRRHVTLQMIEDGIIYSAGRYGDLGFKLMWSARLTEKGKQIAQAICPRARLKAMYRLQRMGYHISAIELPSDVAGF